MQQGSEHSHVRRSERQGIKGDFSSRIRLLIGTSACRGSVCCKLCYHNDKIESYMVNIPIVTISQITSVEI